MLRTVPFFVFQVLLLNSGCGLLLHTDPQPDAGGEADVSVADTSPFDSLVMDTMGPIVDATPSSDAIPPADAVVDAGAQCLPAVDPGTVVAHYTFDADPPSTIIDEGGAHDGTTENGVSHIAGRCGQALSFTSTGGIAHAHIRDHEDFDLEVGSVEFYVMVPDANTYGIISRDARGVQEPGHFSIFTSIEGHVIVRLQDVPEALGGYGDNAVWLCSNRPLRPGVFEHVGVSWGGDQDVQLWLEGQLATLSDEMAISWNSGGTARPVPCGTTVAQLGIDGNSLPWILGANSNLSSETMPDRLDMAFVDGAIDELRILDVRQDFSNP